MKRLPLTALLAAAFVLLLWFVAVRQAALFLVGIAWVRRWPARASASPPAGAS
jgi:hypothetical protein